MLRKFRARFSLPSLLYVCLPVPSTFFASFWTELALGSSALVKVLGQNDRFFSRGSLQQMAFASQKVLWSVPQTVLYLCLRVSPGFWGEWLLFQNKVLWRVPPIILYISLPTGCYFIKSSLEGSANCALY